MISGAMPYFPTTSVAETEGGVHHSNHSQLYHDVMEASMGGGGATGSESQLRSLLCSLSVLKQKVDEVESLVSIILTQEIPHQGPTAVPLASVGTMIQELVMTASSMMFNCQQMSLGSSSQGGNTNTINNNNSDGHTCQGFLDGESFYNWYNDNGATCSNNYISGTARPDSCSRTTTTTTTTIATALGGMKPSGRMVLGSSRKISRESRKSLLTEAYDLVEPDAEDLLAKYTHYCQICGKGFKRDANLRMHMRAHGDEYKTSEALSNPLKKETEDQNNAIKTPRKYSCPQQGCRWNKNHAKFQPLKSIICVKNHYKRSHCPKMYVCKRCNRKQFSVLSDLRTHEKHCGDRKWQCSCGTTFSRKDKLMGHVALFVGHYPVVIPHSENKLDFHGELQIQFEER